MSWYLATPLALPFLTAVFAFLLRGSAIGRWVSVFGNGLLLMVAAVLMSRVLDEGVLAGQMGGWQAPFGITLVADYLGAVMVVITGASLSANEHLELVSGVRRATNTVVIRCWEGGVGHAPPLPGVMTVDASSLEQFAHHWETLG